ncbi:TrmH family RNA methyltransferase, partial [Klebsiella pneumoniae]
IALHQPREADIVAWAQARAPLLVLDGVSNPHNFGAIVRTAAFLGVRHVVLSERPEQAVPSDAAVRVAEGGLEHVVLWRPPALAP